MAVNSQKWRFRSPKLNMPAPPEIKAREKISA
jgi:hypothetical protein